MRRAQREVIDHAITKVAALEEKNAEQAMILLLHERLAKAELLIHNARSQWLKSLVDAYLQTVPDDYENEWYCTPRELDEMCLSEFLEWVEQSAQLNIPLDEVTNGTPDSPCTQG